MLPFQYIFKALHYKEKVNRRLILTCRSCKLEQEVFEDQLDNEGFWDCPYCDAENETYGCGLGSILQMGE